ncbi:hypothetical protein [Achromobacter sp. 2789STDY5608628]|uniref:hypothetical protein n=1 Tax=Achromobacter sp. 2789STDY5608628 TaxID=1806493 RepID=UPI0006BECA03|nr:hypothetical protein [Achromobacter sp. 2789STDY5608628]CUJ80940.1 Uncharacterised protein [Achromobacter sp. 2789STDY5608628]
MTKPRNPTEQLAAATRGRALYIRLYDNATAELGKAKAELQDERIKHAQALATLGNVAHALETGTPPDTVLTIVRIALRIGPGGQPL